MPRADLSNDLVHWIKGESDEAAYDVLFNIVWEGQLVGGTGFIKGGYRCVCFTEAPKFAFHQVVGKYRPFGICLPKQWLFAQGGRHVIYQEESEFDDLPESHRWRHVRYEPDGTPPVDFSWEREWRIQTDELALDPDVASVIVPHWSYAHALEGRYNQAEIERIEWEAQAYGDESLLGQPRRPFLYSCVVNPRVSLWMKLTRHLGP